MLIEKNKKEYDNFVHIFCCCDHSCFYKALW